ncbi:MAG: FAD-binding oxidoreductase [Steroidobacteraceae bacterium]
MRPALGGAVHGVLWQCDGARADAREPRVPGAATGNGVRAFARSRRAGCCTSRARRSAPPIEALAAELRSGGGDPRPVSGGEVSARVPVVRGAASGLLEPEARDIDAGGLVDGYLRLLRTRGGELRRNAELRGIESWGSRLVAQFAGGELEAGTIVNAAGAWAGEVAWLAGALPIGLAPLRRTAFTIDLPEGVEARAWPCVIDVEERLYFKPDAGRLLVSPADETPSVPCDAQADDFDVALAVERLEAMTSLRVTRVRARWAGLRTFAPDRTPLVGFDPRAPGFFWLAGQGGYGLQTSAAMARAAAALATGSGWPADLAAQGVRPEALAPDRYA